MTELKANIWDDGFYGYWRIIPINTVVKTNGELVMSAGLAKQAAERYSDLPKILGEYYLASGHIRSICFVKAKRLVAFPTKIHFSSKSVHYVLMKTFEEK